MKQVIIFLILCIQVVAQAKTLKIAIIDSGYNLYNNSLKLCINESIDLTNTGLNDKYLHGQNVSHIIANRLGNKDYCIVMIKIFEPGKPTTPSDFAQAVAYAIQIKASIINISGGGIGSQNRVEYETINQALDNHIRIIAAAGNDNLDLDKNCTYYPACYSNRIEVVGSLSKDRHKSRLSSYGKYVKNWELGEAVCAGGLCESGTSQATAVHTAKVAYKMIREQELNQCLK